MVAPRQWRRLDIMMRRFVLILIVLVVGIASVVWWRRQTTPAPGGHAQQSGTAAHGGGRHRGGAGGQAIPVVTAPAGLQNVPVYLNAIGTVQAFNTASLKPQVDGTLVEVRFHEGADVRAGDVLARIDPRTYQATLDQAVGKKAQDEALLANARVDLQRYQKLAATAYTSTQTADTQRAQVAQDEALVRQDQAQIDSARTQLSFATITAPFDGRTGLRQVDIGNIVHATDTTPLTVLTQLRPISVVFTLPQQDLPAVGAAIARGKVEVLASLQGVDAPTDQGVLTVLDNQVDAATGTIRLKANFANPDLRLWPGGFVTVRVLTDTVRNAVTIPPSAIQRGPSGSYVYVVDADRVAKRRPVTIGYQDEQAAIVEAGLQANEAVVTDGTSRLTDDAHVTVSSGVDGHPTAAPGRDAAGGAPGAERN